MNTQCDTRRILTDAELDGVRGGAALLLPAVQAAREAARRTTATYDPAGATETGIIAVLVGL